MDEYLYHYTSIDSLVQILSSQSFKFNSLIKCDDIEEAESGDMGKIGRLMFVSCWTNEKEESIPMWSQYSGDMRGVRIGMRKMPFLKHKNRVDGTIIESYLNLEKYRIENKMMFTASQPVILAVEYTNDEQLLYPQLIDEPFPGALERFVSGEDIHQRYSINFDPIGKYKRKCWSFQKEVRYRIFGTPMGIGELDKIQKEQQISGHREFIRRILYDDIPVPYQFLFLDLDPVAIETMEIVFGPRMSKSEELLLSEFLEARNLGDNWRKSELKIQ